MQLDCLLMTFSRKDDHRDDENEDGEFNRIV
ncbi:hypothetical protein PPTG_23960 [Phytophthora nicotianae INRA-310]|uniref:Uncharacterized protein n=1 Tax=Phytophthora nicotianae (strain INRA-310) TaxID=761204 RepID=W2PNN6_PHYN3|nr:hypothetical protein PPTG_23960 [Phytophthora nicotianae INRA-310]ETN02236.1 hypothetical protein PPTG_23960 [Phytophthora nicotianae INRA-310]